MDRLYRSRDDRMLAGVAGGLAQMWGADPSLVRVIWALLAIFTGGLAFIVYIVMALVIPEEPLLPDAADGQALVEGTPAAGAQSARATRRAASGNSNSIPAAAIFGNSCPRSTSTGSGRSSSWGSASCWWCPRFEGRATAPDPGSQRSAGSQPAWAPNRYLVSPARVPDWDRLAP